MNIALVGIGGYGEVYLSALLDEPLRDRCRLVAVADPEPQRCSRLADLRAAGVEIFESFEALADQCHADLVLIASSIHTHCDLTCAALARGGNVLCEKPAAATVREVDRMIEAERQAGRFVAVGFQWSFTDGIRDLKRDIRSGAFGSPRRAKTLTLWPRPESYYARNDWAGRLRSADGRWILDSPANNAMAHDLHNLLYLLGNAPETSAAPIAVQAETYRAHDIETFDTIALGAHTANEVELLFLASHATAETIDPTFVIECDEAAITFAGGDAPIVAAFADGRRRSYPSPNAAPHSKKVSDCLDALHDGSPIPCGLAAARCHALCVKGIHASTPQAVSFATSLAQRVERDGERFIAVSGLGGVLRRCFEEAALPHELGAEWAHCGESVDPR